MPRLRVETHEKVALLVRPGQGKSTIMRMLAGLDRPDRGTVLRDAGGWPLGYAGGFHADMSGDDNIRNFAELADVDPLELSAFCYDYSELGDLYHRPVKLYSSTMKARLAMAASLGIPARTYLADDKLIRRRRAIPGEMHGDPCRAAKRLRPHFHRQQSAPGEGSLRQLLRA